MRTLTALIVGFAFLLVCTGCHTAQHAALSHDEIVYSAYQSASAVVTLKALDSDNTKYAYRVTLLQLKNTMLRIQWYLKQEGVTPEEEHMLKGHSLTVLKYLENQKERLGEDSALDHSALRIAEVLADTLTGPEDLKRVEVLRDYFGGRFIEEREFYK